MLVLGGVNGASQFIRNLPQRFWVYSQFLCIELSCVVRMFFCLRHCILCILKKPSFHLFRCSASSSFRQSVLYRIIRCTPLIISMPF